MGYSIDILNNIRDNASDEYAQRIPQATRDNIIAVGNALQQYKLLQNEFISSLIGRIGKTIIETKLFKNKLARFKAGAINNAQDVEEIFIEMAKAEGNYNPQGPNPLGRRNPPEVKSIYHRRNRQDYYAISIGTIDYVQVFRSEANLDSFILGLINSVYSGAAYDEWVAIKELMATYTGYFDYEVPEITGDNTAEAAKQFVKTVRKATADMSYASTQYNAAHVKTWSDKEKLCMFVNKDVTAEVDVEVLAKAFNLGKTDVQIEIVEMDDFGTLTDTYAIIADRDWFRIWDTLSHMEPQRNAQGLFTNYFYHVHQILSLSMFKNAVRLKKVAAA